MQSLVDINLRQLLDDGKVVHLSSAIDLHEYVQPASIDLPIGDVVYHVKKKYLPFDVSIGDVIDDLVIEEYDATESITLYKNQTYLIPCLRIQWQEWLSYRVSPKSSIGRIDVLVRSVFDQIGLYDSVFVDQSGELWLEVTPKSFNISVTRGVALSQIMCFDEQEQRVNMAAIKQSQFLSLDGVDVAQQRYDQKVLIDVGVSAWSLVWYKALATDQVIDLTQVGSCRVDDFFVPVYAQDDASLMLEKDRFYILATKHDIRIPTAYAAELIPSSHLVGELRVHYAGFFDPWFGGETGATGVLEVRAHEDIIIHDGQPLCLMSIYPNRQSPTVAYGSAWNHYNMQRWPKLAKYFS